MQDSVKYFIAAVFAPLVLVPLGFVFAGHQVLINVHFCVTLLVVVVLIGLAVRARQREQRSSTKG